MVPAAYACTTWGTPSLDLGAAVTAQLERSRLHRARRRRLHAGVCRPLLPPPRRCERRPLRRHRRTPGARPWLTRSPRRDRRADSTTVRGRIAAAAAAVRSRRRPTSRWSWSPRPGRSSDLEILLDLGVHDVGENQHQEAEEKAARAGRSRRDAGTSSARSSPTRPPGSPAYADVVHSVDSVRVAQRLNAGAHAQRPRASTACPGEPRPASPSARHAEASQPAEVDELAARDRDRRRAAAARRDGGRAAWAATPSRRTHGWPRSEPAARRHVPGRDGRSRRA